MSTPEVRQRRPAVETPTKKEPSLAARVKAEDAGGNVLVEILRTLVFLGIASSALSYFVTRESLVWGLQRPKWTKGEFIQAWMEGPKQYTDADLKNYNGENPDLPILLAINGSIYDVSAGRKHYGPGGSYSFFSGCDASRAFVTQCFDTDANPDMRGVEEMFLPLDDPEIDSLYTSAELKNLKAQEKRRAQKEIEKALGHWTSFFANSPKYPKIGEVKREPGWENKGPAPKLCKRAQDGRKTRKRPEGR